MYLLWADDLVMLAETAEGLQGQIDRLAKYCHRNQLIINALKTEIVIFGKKSEQSEFHVHGNPIEIVDSYKYLGVLFSSCTTLVGNPFKNNFQYLADNAGKAIHSFYSYSNILGRFPVRTSFALFDSLVTPILEYGSEIWGVIESLDCIEKSSVEVYILAICVPQSQEVKHARSWNKSNLAEKLSCIVDGKEFNACLPSKQHCKKVIKLSQMCGKVVSRYCKNTLNVIYSNVLYSSHYDEWKQNSLIK